MKSLSLVIDVTRRCMSLFRTTARVSEHPRKSRKPPSAPHPYGPDVHVAFILPSSLGEEEIKTVCAAYRQLDRDGRQLLRLFAQAAIAAA